MLTITEAHPKALLWALGIANRRRRASDVQSSDLVDLVTGPIGASEHERDAVLAGVAAWAAWARPGGWTNLVEQEVAPLLFTAAPVAYWFPTSAA